jgi:hypothetical protein
MERLNRMSGFFTGLRSSAHAATDKPLAGNDYPEWHKKCVPASCGRNHFLETTTMRLKNPRLRGLLVVTVIGGALYATAPAQAAVALT